MGSSEGSKFRSTLNVLTFSTVFRIVWPNSCTELLHFVTNLKRPISVSEVALGFVLWRSILAGGILFVYIVVELMWPSFRLFRGRRIIIVTSHESWGLFVPGRPQSPFTWWTRTVESTWIELFYDTGYIHKYIFNMHVSVGVAIGNFHSINMLF